MEPLTAEDRRRRNRQQARRAILEATEALMLEGGSDDFSIRRVATRCGYSAPTIYHYETRAPMAVATAAGMFSSMLLTLLIVPVLYLLLDDGVEWVKGLFRRSPREVTVDGAG